jgi:glutamine amidotransferase
MKNSNKQVVIIDYGLGNLFSVNQACQTVGLNVKISNLKEEIKNADAIILPGVGAFIEAMNNLEKMDLVNTIKESVENGKPFFGICLGMQLIFSKSEEFGSGNGLDLIPGIIKKFPTTFNEQIVKVPQIAWNKMYSFKKKWIDTPLFDINENEFMYFVHSYYAEPLFEESILTRTNYNGIEYCSAVMKDNIFATQFHPEKSAEKGIKIYKNWATINNLV